MTEIKIAEYGASADCTGCASCYNACAHGALQMTPDAEGFLRPTLELQLCRGCRRCEHSCPGLQELAPLEQSASELYAAWHNDPAIRASSSSGGLFSVFAEEVFAQHGVVFAVGYGDDLTARFCCAHNVEELAAQRVSKYVQAEVGAIYRQVKSVLQEGRVTLFCGTPCQVAGLRQFLSRDYDNLLTIDLVCHGVPSPLLFRKWVDWLGKRLGDPIKNVNFRSKSQGGSHTVRLTFQGPRDVVEFPWRSQLASYIGTVFLKNIALRPSCSRCRYSQIKRVGDITLGDFWGAELPATYQAERHLGVSLVIVNSARGAKWRQKVASGATWLDAELSRALTGNHSLRSPAPAHAQRDAFMAALAQNDYPTVIRMFKTALYGSSRTRFLNRLKRLVK
ncbi:MAG: Coenzyme F420 hydrogenase/dehydrogenase, beta subunit C-terminal domain [Planctomycetia bacterium]|nr:Coenzyme F420 hydrogenase/dehydrogenase, beta subunit C-terminal domain [Planctomycetia bacterium]